jgi:hypothetical protein
MSTQHVGFKNITAVTRHTEFWNVTRCNLVQICLRYWKQATVEPRFTNAPVQEQFGLRTNFSSKKRLGWRTVSRITNTQAGNSGKLRVSARESGAG